MTEELLFTTSSCITRTLGQSLKKKVGDQLKTKECLELTATGNC